MDRQVIPSMILSVLIVGFFSIVLYEPDKPKAKVSTAKSDAAPPATSAPALPKVEKAVAPSALDPPAAPRAPVPSNSGKEQPQPDPKNPARTESAQSQTADPHGSTAPVADEQQAKPLARADAPTVAPEKVQETARAGPDHAVSPPPSPPTLPASKTAHEPADSAPARIMHRSAFTTVKEGETLEDVAARIYGSLDKIDLIWKSNRDVLPQKNSRLLPGTVLRTPEG